MEGLSNILRSDSAQQESMTPSDSMTLSDSCRATFERAGAPRLLKCGRFC